MFLLTYINNTSLINSRYISKNLCAVFYLKFAASLTLKKNFVRNGVHVVCNATGVGTTDQALSFWETCCTNTDTDCCNTDVYKQG